jgi:hypothetical protein
MTQPTQRCLHIRGYEQEGLRFGGIHREGVQKALDLPVCAIQGWKMEDAKWL